MGQGSPCTEDELHTIFFVQGRLRKLQGLRLSVREMKERIQKELDALQLNVKVGVLRHKRSLEYVSVSGAAEIHDDNGCRIILYLHVPYFRRWVTLNRQFMGRVVGVLAHELRHRYQLKQGVKFPDNALGRERNKQYLDDYKPQNVTDYLSDFTEIDAYAYQYAVMKHFNYKREWIRKFYEDYVRKQNPVAWVKFGLKAEMALL